MIENIDVHVLRMEIGFDVDFDLHRVAFPFFGAVEEGSYVPQPVVECSMDFARAGVLCVGKDIFIINQWLVCVLIIFAIA